MRAPIRIWGLLILPLLGGCYNSPLSDALSTRDNYYASVSDIVDRYGYHYYRGPYAPDRKYEPMYYNNTGYFNTVSPARGRVIYAHAYDNYNNGYYKGGFYGNEYYQNGFFNNGYFNPGNCRGENCYKRWMK